MITTLNKIRDFHPCTDGWSQLLKSLNKTRADDEPLLISTIFKSNGLDDALWCLRAVDGCDKELQLYAVRRARSVQHLMTDLRSINVIDVAERFANGEATKEELEAAKAAAGEAGEAARGASWAAAEEDLAQMCKAWAEAKLKAKNNIKE